MPPVIKGPQMKLIVHSNESNAFSRCQFLPYTFACIKRLWEFFVKKFPAAILNIRIREKRSTLWCTPIAELAFARQGASASDAELTFLP